MNYRAIMGVRQKVVGVPRKLLPGRSWIRPRLGQGGKLAIGAVLGVVLAIAIVIGRGQGGGAQASAPSSDSLALAASAQRSQAHGDYERAIALYAKAVALTPADVSALIGEAQSYEGLHLYPSALSTLNLAVSRDPQSWDSPLARAQLEAQLGEEGKALSDIRAALRLAPAGDTSAFLTAASIYSRLNDSGDALSMITHAIKSAPNLPTLYAQRAALWITENNDYAADSDYLRAAKLANGVDALNYLQMFGDQAQSQGESSEALSAFGREGVAAASYLQQYPHSAIGHLLYAHALFGYGDRADAWRELRTAVRYVLASNSSNSGTDSITALQEFADWAAGPNANAWPMAEYAYRAEVKAAHTYLRSHPGDSTAEALLSHATSQLPSS